MATLPEKSYGVVLFFDNPLFDRNLTESCSQNGIRSRALPDEKRYRTSEYVRNNQSYGFRVYSVNRHEENRKTIPSRLCVDRIENPTRKSPLKGFGWSEISGTNVVYERGK
ncbi:Hypothetical protein CINCED_3A008296 [Cinara cedri]|uniref:Uncharacterized protein n=1 Tax=Cinara cedri TaxID=506608 RepID=A0A5E4MES0_9HEMI|nr:Hypothetical protein CINCED_3A008296 [Cinara cedri]